MNYPDFETNVLITISPPFPKEYIVEIMKKGLENSGLTFLAQEKNDNNGTQKGQWISITSFIELYVTDKFIENHIIKSTKELEIFIDNLALLVQPLIKLSAEIKKNNKSKRTRPFPLFSIFYKTRDNYKFQFVFDFLDDKEKFTMLFNSVFDSINIYNKKGGNKFKKTIKETYNQKNKIKYFALKENTWSIVNPLLEVGKEININYKESNDFRIKKPTIVLHEENYNKYFIYDRNWFLAFDDLKTLMLEPNDVSIYSNISDKNLEKAQKFYSEIIIPRYKYYHGNFPTIEQQKEYFDYFEHIINSLIFAYTALETFANICIPEDYEFIIEKNGVKTIYSKKAIELQFSLRDKFKKIFREILNTTDPTQEKWWNKFIDLEKLRDEIIHTKPSKSEERYSKLLSKRIFEIIDVHKDIIKYYGYYISENNKELLDLFPYNFGYDNSFPALMDDKYYEQEYKSLYNPQPLSGEKK